MKRFRGFCDTFVLEFSIDWKSNLSQKGIFPLYENKMVGIRNGTHVLLNTLNFGYKNAVDCDIILKRTLTFLNDWVFCCIYYTNYLFGGNNTLPVAYRHPCVCYTRWCNNELKTTSQNLSTCCACFYLRFENELKSFCVILTNWYEW